MGWLERCYQTYEKNISEVGKTSKNERGREKPILLPVAHTTQKVQIEVSLSAAGDFRSARVLRPDEMTAPRNPPPAPPARCPTLWWISCNTSPGTTPPGAG